MQRRDRGEKHRMRDSEKDTDRIDRARDREKETERGEQREK
jgi:hypothetical protein